MVERAYGWAVVAATFVILTMGFGVAYSFPAFFTALQNEFGARRADISLIFGIAAFLYFGLGAVSGILADRFGPRWIVVFGMLVVGVGMLLAARAEALWQIYLFYGGAVGIGVGFAYVPAIGAVQPWFEARRGFASGIAVSGIGAGTLAAPIIAHELMALSDWRGAYQVLGWATIILGGAAALIITRPVDRAGVAAKELPGSSLRQAIRSRPFLFIHAGMAASSFALFVPFVHLVNYARDHGIGAEMAIWITAMIGLGSLVGRFAIGGIADRIGRRPAFLGMFASLTVATLFWYFSTSPWALAAFAVAFGSFYGGVVALAPALMADYFGARSISSIIGALYTSVALGSLVGPVAAGYAYDLMNNYDGAILFCAALFFLAFLLTMAAPKPEIWRQQAARM